MSVSSDGRPPSDHYRRDIDGLRAVAILMVVGGHVGIPGMTGGFTGVDVFFSISGYVITAVLLREREQTGRILVADFLARRARRLLPLLSVVVLATLLAGLFVLLPDEQIALAQSALAAMVFSANIFFSHADNGYFAEPNGLLPLQHLWTLAVEEQFYLLWPMTMVLVARVAGRFKRPAAKPTAGLLVAVTCASLLLSVALTARFPLPSFYLLPTRGWELGAGGLLAFAPNLGRRCANLVAPLSLIAIAASTWAFSERTPFPSYFAILPVLGAVGLMASGNGASGAVTRLLSSPPMVALGRRSYGWYLWHWPLLAYARTLWGPEPALVRNAGLAGIALLLAAVSWRWIEQPVRLRHVRLFATTKGALIGGVAILLICGVGAGSLWVWAGRPPAPGSIWAQYRAAHAHADRDFAFCEGWGDRERCEVGARLRAPTVLLWGDSHAAQLGLGLDHAARASGITILVRTKADCSPGGYANRLGRRMDAAAAASCAAFNADTLAAISRLKQDRNLSGVVLAGEWAVRQPGWDRQLDQRVAALRDAGLRVIIARDVPAFPSRFMVCATRRAPSDCALDRHQVELDRASSDAVITQIAAGKADVRTWTPLDALCPAQRCMSVIARRLLYRNPTHLTLDGSAYLAPSMGAMIDWLAPKPAQGSAGASSRSPRRLGAGRRRMRTGRAGPS